MNNVSTRLVGFFGGGFYNKETRNFEIKKNVSKSGNLSLGMQYKISSKDTEGNKIYNGLKVKLLLNDKSELAKVEKLIEDRCVAEGFFSAVEFQGQDSKVKYVEFICKIDDFKALADYDTGTVAESKPNENAKPKEEFNPWED